MNAKQKKRKQKDANPELQEELEYETPAPPVEVDLEILESIVQQNEEVEIEENIINDYEEEAKRLNIDTNKKILQKKKQPATAPVQAVKIEEKPVVEQHERSANIPKIGTYREEVKKRDKTEKKGKECKGCGFQITETDVYIKFKCGHYMHDTCKERSVTLFSQCCECSSPSAKQYKTESEKFIDSLFIPTSQNLPCNKIAGIQAIYMMTSGEVGNLVQSPYGKHVADSLSNSKEPINPNEFGRSRPAASVSNFVKSIVPQIYFETNPETAAVNQYSDERWLDNRIRKFMARSEPKMMCQEMVLQGVTIMDIISDQIFIDEWCNAGYSPLALKAFTNEFRFLQHDLKFQMRHFNLLYDLEKGIENKLSLFCEHFRTPRGAPINGEYVYKELLKSQWMGLSDNKVNGYVMSHFGFDINWLLKNVPETCWHMFKYLSPQQFVMIGLDSDMFISSPKVAKMIKVFNWDDNILATTFGVQIVDPKKSISTNASKNNQITVQQCSIYPPVNKPPVKETIPQEQPVEYKPPISKPAFSMGGSAYVRGKYSYQKPPNEQPPPPSAPEPVKQPPQQQFTPSYQPQTIPQQQQQTSRRVNYEASF